MTSISEISESFTFLLPNLNHFQSLEVVNQVYQAWRLLREFYIKCECLCSRSFSNEEEDKWVGTRELSKTLHFV